MRRQQSLTPRVEEVQRSQQRRLDGTWQVGQRGGQHDHEAEVAGEEEEGGAEKGATDMLAACCSATNGLSVVSWSLHALTCAGVGTLNFTRGLH